MVGHHGHVDLPTTLRSEAHERSDRWQRAGLAWHCEAGPITDNPAAWLTLRSASTDAFLKVWTSGDAEMDWGHSPEDAQARHYDLSSVDDLRACLDDLEGVFQLPA